MNILSDFSYTIAPAITILYALITFTVILRLRQKLSKAKFTIDLLRDQQHQHVYTVKPNRPAPLPPPKSSELEMIFGSNLNTINLIQSLTRMFFARLEKEHRPPSPQEIQNLHSMRNIISTLKMVEDDIVYRWEEYTKNLTPSKKEEQ